VSLLSVLRSLRIKGYMSPALITLKSQLTGRFTALVREKRIEELELTDLVGGYNELSFFRAGQECRLVAGKIARLLEEGVAQGRIPFTNSQAFFLLHCLSQRAELSPPETNIRSQLLRRVVEQLSSIKLHELVRVAVSLNRMEFFDLTGEEFSQVRMISQRIAEGVTALDENSLYEFIRGEFNSKFNGFFRIYEEINNNLFAEISEKGDIEIDPEAFFRMLGHLADKIPLERLPESDQRKFFVFMRNYAQTCREDSAMAKGFGHKLYGLVSNGYFSGEQRQKVVDIIAENELPVNTNLLYEFATRDYSLAPFTHSLAEYDIATLKEEILLKVAVIAHHITTQGGDVANLKAQLEQRVAGIVATPQKFIEFTRRLGRYSVSVREFHLAFEKTLEQLPNPFVTT
jgi:hypothetical protein